MQTAPRFIMIGGFLGAGKTTTIARLAKRFQDEGNRVVIVTNDQATDLVDTLLLRAEGFDVGEVAGSCFCCNFNELTRAVEQLGSESRPDVVLAEPVGSCTDLVATVIRPLEQIYDQPFAIAPYGVIIKPSHSFKILGGEDRRGFSPKAEYIFRKQIEEADFIIINRIDELSPTEADQLTETLNREFPDTPVVRMSAKSGEGFDALCEFLNQGGASGRRVMDVDYDVYAEGEAELGWLNCQATLQASEAFALDAFLMQLLQRLHNNLLDMSAEVAHLKVIGMADGAHGVANLISNASRPVLSLPSDWTGRQANLVVNARVAVEPDTLTALVEEALEKEASAVGGTAAVVAMQSFRPGRPVPTHRLLS